MDGGRPARHRARRILGFLGAGLGLWLAQAGPARAEEGPERPDPGPPAAGTRARGLFLLDAGGTSQVNQGTSGVAEMALGGLVESSRFSWGAVGRLGVRRNLVAWAAALAAGRAYPQADGTQVLLLGELGVAGLSRDGQTDGFLWGGTMTGGSSALPYLGARILLGLDRERPAFAVGLFVQQTLGTSSVHYTLEQCWIFGCSTSARSARDGGFSAGVSLGWSIPTVTTRSSSEATPR